MVLLYGLVSRETGLRGVKALAVVVPWIIYIAFIVAGSMRIDDITRALNTLVEAGEAWRWAP